MIDLVNAVTTGATVAGALRGLAALESFLGHRNGNGKRSTNGFTLADHDAILLNGARAEQIARDHKEGFQLLHEDLEDVKREIRDLRA